MNEVCESVGSVGEGLRVEFTAHGLHGTCITFRFGDGHKIQVIGRKSGHPDPRSALSSHNTQVVLGQKLYSNMFCENVPDLKKSYQEANVRLRIRILA